MGKLCKTVILLILIPAIAYAGPRAVHIAIDDAGSKYTSTNVEGALQEIHAPVTVADTTTVNLTLSTQQISADGLYTAGDGLTLTGADFDCDTANGSTFGCLSSTDWTTFNGKQAAGNYITALTGDVTASGPGSVAATIATGAVGADELASTTVTPGSYTSTNLTVDADGRITAASNGSGGGLTSADIDTSAELDTIVTDDTGSGALVFATSPTLVTPALGVASATSITSAIHASGAGDPADSGAFRLGNSEQMCWEASPASTDVCVSVDSSERFAFTGPVNATTGYTIAGVAANGTILRGNGTNFVATTATYPATTTVSQILYSSSANVIAGLATANSGMLVTSGSGVPSISTTATMDANKFTLGASKGMPGFITFRPQQGKLSHFSTGPAPAEISDGLKRWYALFDPSADECIDFQDQIPFTYNTNQTITVLGNFTSSVASNAVGWMVSFMATTPGDSADIETDSFATARTDSETYAGTQGYLDQFSITFTSAQADNLTPGDLFTMRVCRDGDGSTVTDSNTGDAELTSVVMGWN